MPNFDFVNQELDQKLTQTKKKIIRVSFVRLFAFFGLGALLILALTDNLFWGIPALGMGYFFVHLIQNFNFLKDQEAIYLALQQMNLESAKRQTRQLNGLIPGAEFVDKSHPFANDLDLFGDHSLFQLLNHTVSSGGKHRLAALLKSQFDKEESEKRAHLVAELKSKALFLQAMEAGGLALKRDDKESGAWTVWLNAPEKIPGWTKFLAFLGPLGGVVMLILVISGILPEALLGVWILIGIGFLSSVFQPLKKAAEAIPTAATLKSFLIRTDLIEKEDFDCMELKSAKAELSKGGVSASGLLGELDKLGLWAQNRINLLYLPVNLLFWTDFILFVQLAAWKNRVGQSLSHLPENLEVWEVWVSLGAFEVELEGAGIVKWTDDTRLSAVELTHPLILPEKSVSNSIDFDLDQRLILLTGANMSGKTTFMRTLGINCVLANLGLSPFGTSLQLGNIQLYTSMRNSDNLGESVSSFYAELRRIHTLLERLESGEPLFFLLDEILKGTNTQDRISGSEALICQILQTKGFGIISTHDIELSELEQSVEKVRNFSFHSEIHDKSIDFDYRIKKGPCPSFNAHKLMELMGIRFNKT